MTNRTALVIAMVLGLPALSLAQGERKVEYLTADPPTGALPYRKVVYVDDGTCPKGQVKEVTGGSREKAIPRTIRCVERPR
jgi:hypothetical protein